MPMLISNVSKIAMDAFLRLNSNAQMARHSMPGREDVLLQLQLQHQPEPLSQQKPLPLLAQPPGVQEEANFSELLEMRMPTSNANRTAMDASRRLSKDAPQEKLSMLGKGNVWLLSQLQPLPKFVLHPNVPEEVNF